MATVKVRGRGTVQVAPDEAVVTFEVVVVADGAAEAFATAGERTKALDAVLDDAGIDLERRSTLGIVLHELQEFDAEGQPRRTHRASTTVSVRFAHADAIPPLLRAAVERADAYVRGPVWRLSDSSDAAAEACRRAAADAAARAEAYAAALGLGVGAVERVEEAATAEHAGVAGLAMRSAMAAEPPPIYPGELQVSAVVDVVFALEPA
jgi:uncharacterized protein YggE